MKNRAMTAWTIPAALALLLAGCGGGTGEGDDLATELGVDVPGTDLAGDAGPDGGRDDGGDATEPGDAADGMEVDAGPCDASAKIAEGKEWLGKAQPVLARDAFRAALALCPDDPQAHFGAALAAMTDGTELFMALLTVLSGQGTGPKLPQDAVMSGLPMAPAGAESQNEWLAGELRRVFKSLAGTFDDARDHLVALGDRDPGFEVAEAWVYLGIRPAFVFRGRFDRGDVKLMQGVASLFTGFLDAVAAQDFRADVLALISKARAGVTGDVDFVWISRFLAFLLNDDDRFLRLHPEDGAALLAESRERLADVGPLLVAAIDLAREAGSGDDEVSFVEDLDVGTALNVLSRVREGEGGTVVEEPWYLLVSERTLTGLLDASRSIREPGFRVTLHGAVTPTLAVVLGGLIRAGALDAAGISLPAGLDLSTLETDEIVALLNGLLPNVLAFDWGAFYTDPIGLREMLPATTTDRPLWQDILVMEWECPAETEADGFPAGSLRLMCKDDAVLADAAHFEGTPWAAAADGTASAFPVLAFPDPTMNGLLFVNLEGVANDRDADGYVAADQATLNAALAKLLGGILGLL